MPNPSFSGSAFRGNIGTSSPTRYTPNNIPARAVNATVEVPMQSNPNSSSLVHNNNFTGPPAYAQDPIRTRNLGSTYGVDVPGSYQVQPNPSRQPIQVGRPAASWANPYDFGSPGQGLALGVVGTLGYLGWEQQNYGARIQAGEYETLRQKTGYDPVEWSQIPNEKKERLKQDWDNAANPFTGGEKDPAKIFQDFSNQNPQYQQPFGPQFPKQAYGPEDKRTGPFFPVGESDPNSPYSPWARNPETGQPYSPAILQAAKEAGVDPFFINPETGKPLGRAPNPNDINPDTGAPYNALPFNPFGDAPGGAISFPSNPIKTTVLPTGKWTVGARADYNNGTSSDPETYVFQGLDSDVFSTQSNDTGWDLTRNGAVIIANYTLHSNGGVLRIFPSFTPDIGVVPEDSPPGTPTAIPIGNPDPTRQRATPSAGSPSVVGSPGASPANPTAPKLDPKAQPAPAPAATPNSPASPGNSPVNPKSPSPSPFSPGFMPFMPFVPVPGRSPGMTPAGNPGGSPHTNPGAFTSTNTSANPRPNPTPTPTPTTSCSYREDETQPQAVDYVTVTPIGRVKAPKVIQVHEKMAEATQLQFKVLGEMRESLDKIEKNTKISKVMHMVSMATTIHNAMMLSRDLAETLGNVTGMIFTAVGRMSGAVGESDFVNVNEILGGEFNKFMEGVLGKELWSGTKESWLKASRIYQSGANIVNSIRDIADSTRDIAEFTANNVSKIGNAMRKFRVVGWDAYGTMDEDARAKSKFFRNMDKAIDKGEKLENAASSLGGVAGNVLSIQDEVKDIKENRDAFKKGIEEWGKKDAEKQKKDEANSKVDEDVEEKDLK
jgi:hypothetical protein